MNRRRFIKGIIGAGFTITFSSIKILEDLLPHTLIAEAFYEVTKLYIRTVEKPTPTIDPEKYRLKIGGLVKKPLDLTYKDILKMPQKKQTSDLHCVEGWGKKGIKWKGVKLSHILDLVGIDRRARFLKFICEGDVYSESLTIDEATEDETLLVVKMDGKPLPIDHGFPLRLIVPRMFGYKSVKWVKTIELTVNRHLGYWEKFGYNSDGMHYPNGRKYEP